jgi:glycerol-3-phosphate acyltransferase PlsX
MDDPPLVAVRRKKDSSMAVGVGLLKEHKMDALVSAGNTGALVAFARLNLPLLPTITSLSLLVLLPKEKGRVAVLDVGANISFKPLHLVEYAKLGRLYFQIVHGLENPKVGLLNIGVEEKKGTAMIKEGYQILSEYFEKTPEAFLGNIEGKNVFQSNSPDVLITDGFTGNVFLKTCEGVFSFIVDFFKKQ